MRLLGVGLFCACLFGAALHAGLPSDLKDTRDVDFVLNRSIPVNFLVQTEPGSGRIEVPWIRVEPTFGNAWSLTACVGWSAIADATWRIRVELLDDKGNVLRHSRDGSTTFTCKAAKENPDMTRYAEIELDSMQWENRRHAAKIRVVLERAQDPMVHLPPDGSASFPLTVCAIDGASDKPIADAAVIAKASYRGAEYRSHLFLYRTDAAGECRVAFEKADLRGASVTIQKPGYATLAKSWSTPYVSSLAAAPLAELPSRQVMKMSASRTIGGIVQDQGGAPIAEAQVRVDAYLQDTGGVMSVSRSVPTDAEGRWEVRGIPVDADRISLGFKHPQYVGDWATRSIRGDEISTLFDRKHVVTLTKGLTVSGRVLDDQGRPLSRVAVILAPAYSQGFRYEYAYTLTDGSGSFRFNCSDNDRADTTEDGGSTGVLVETPGYVPMLQRVVVEPNLAPLEFRLSRGRPLTVRVVDANDRPIAGAATVVDALTEDHRYGYWLDDTDDQGRVRIPNAPNHEVLFTVMQSGYVSVRGHALAVSDDEQVVKMEPSPRIRGVVRDARTGDLVREFAVSVQEAVSPGRVMAGDPIRFKEGRFELIRDEARTNDLQLRVLAVGYKPTTSEAIRMEGVRTLEFKLEADPSFDAKALEQAIGRSDRSETLVVTGTVVDPNGRPVPKAAINVYPPSSTEAITTAEGEFKLRCSAARFGMMGMPGPGQNLTPYVLARSRDRNLAVAMEFDQTAAEDLKIALSPGVILSGKVTDAQGKEVPGAKLSLTFWPGQMGFGMPEESARPDASGRFEIRAVPAGHRFSVSATAEGYGQEYVDARTDQAVGSRMDLEPMVLKPANLEISGVVVDVNDQPVSGIRVGCFGRGQRPRPQIKTDAQGRFVIRGVCAGPASVQANSSDRNTPLFGQVQTEGGATDVRIVVSSRMMAGRYVPAKPRSLVGKPLPPPAQVGLESAMDAAADRAILLCFFDMNQRPSRNAVTTLAKRAEELKQKGVTLIAVQAAEAEGVALEQWVKDQGLAIPVGSIKTDIKKTTFAWGVQSLPWLILTDKNHNVMAEGFPVGELDAKIGKTGP